MATRRSESCLASRGTPNRSLYRWLEASLYATPVDPGTRECGSILDHARRARRDGPGGRGWLPSPGSRRSGRARFAHPAPRTMASLRWRAPASRRFGRLSASCRACGETAAGAVARPSVRPTVHDPIRRFPPPGPRGAGSPDFRGTISGLRLLAARPAALRLPSLGGTTVCPVRSRSLGPCQRAGTVVYRGRPCRLAGGDDETSQVPGRPLPACPALRPRRNRQRPASLGAAVVPSALVTASASARRTISGLNHAACKASCVRFAAGVAPGPRNTRFRLVGQPWPVRSFTCRVATEGFRHVIACTSPFAKLRLAQDKPVPYGVIR